MGNKDEKRTLIDLPKNIQFCLNFGFSTLITVKNVMDYRNSIISIHNGVELLMKLYLQRQNRLLILPKVDHLALIKESTNVRKDINLEKVNFSKTITYDDCIIRLGFFSVLPETSKVHLQKLNYYRNHCVHYEFYFDRKEIRRLLISHIYQFIRDLIIEMKLTVNDFINQKYITSLDIYKKNIDDEIKNNLIEIIEVAKKHYFDELTSEEREQKKSTESYTLDKFDKNVSCPACDNNALLQKKVIYSEDQYDPSILSKETILKELSCHYCGLHIRDYDQLRMQFTDEEEVITKIKVPTDCPDDCPTDCPDDCPTDCPDDCPTDCPDDCPTDCPDDCPTDCPDDCPTDCPVGYSASKGKS
ncbi:MAG: hypothetical protein JW837_19305 [Sedimentisphaerales bacterium]|nr:hypothetical protein [Sedimentisphaerales bacterium]